MSSTTLYLIIAIVAMAVAAAIVRVTFTRRRTERLQQQFGPEYDRQVEEAGEKSRAERVLQKRAERVERLHVRDLSPADRTRYLTEWQRLQTAFVDDPASAITAADRLIGQVMAARGYPVADFGQRAADISVDHPVVVENYRAAHAIALRHAQTRASTEEMRQAMIHYRTLFEELVGQREVAQVRVAS